MPANNQDTTGAANTKDLHLLREAALEAGELALSFFGKDPETWLKGGKSPVSEADLAVDGFLADTLKSARPDYGWLSEETLDDKERLNRERTFIIDPIDGTRAFLAGGVEWTVAVAVVEKGRPIAGVVYAPVRKELYTAQKGGGSFLNDIAISVAGSKAVAGATLSGPPSVNDHEDLAGLGVKKTTYIRSLAYRLVLVANGQVDIGVARAGPSDWDLAAADLLVQEAGGTLADLTGQRLAYNKAKTRHPALIAAPVDLLDPARAAFGSLLG